MAARRASALTAALVLVSIPLVLLGSAGSWSLPALAVLALAVVATELRPVHVARDGQRHSFTLTEGPLVAALAIAPGRSLVLAVTAGVLLAQVARGLPRYKVAFNVAQFATATSAASLLAERVTGSVGVLLAVLVFALLNDGVVRLVISLTTGRPAGRPLQDASPVWLLHVTAVCSIALLGAQVYLSDPAALPVFAAPALLVLWSQEQANRRRARATVMDALAGQATAFYGRSSEETAVLLARTAREILAAARTELVLLDGDSLLVLSADADGVQRSRLDHGQLVTGWRGRVFEAATAASADGWAGVVVGREVPRALLGIWRDDEQEAFRRDDVALLQTLADTVAPWLSVTTQDTSLALLRRRLRGMGEEAQGVADALGLLESSRRRLELEPQALATASVAADLKEVEQRVARFVEAILAMDEARHDEPDAVASGRWASA